MSNIAEVHVPAEEFALRETLEEVPDVEFEVERVATHGSDRVLPFVWATGEDLERVEAALETDPSVEDVESLIEQDDARLFRMEWVTHTRVLVYVLTEGNATVLSLSGFENRWAFRVLFPDRDALSATYAFCRERNLTFDLRQVYELSNSSRRGHFGLTDEQHDALVAGIECGYFDVPRGATMDDVAAELGVSRQAVSERLRRGHHRLIESALVIGRADSDPSRIGGF
jgi:predicted DNA binding protein